MKTSIKQKLDHLSTRMTEVDALLSKPGATEDMNEYKRLTKERSELDPIVTAYNTFKATEQAQSDAQEMLSDPEMKSIAEEEIAHTNQQLPELELELQRLLLPTDPDDDKNVILEIRAGTGGDESALFAGDLFRMYKRLTERMRWETEMISSSESGLGGYKEIICRLIGENVYSQLKFESGGHRVQRVPDTETQGRIHTSACTVAVMPEADEVGEVLLNPADLRIDTFRASGAGGQHINKTDSAVRITHIPSGIVSECQDGRSQHQNKASALRVLSARIRDVQVHKQRDHIASTRRSLIGSGDRSERIRTYNFPQGRVTDHRINLTLYKIANIMDGDMSEILSALSAEHQADLLASMADHEK